MRSLLPLGPALFAALTLSTLAPRARADVAPPFEPVESCTMKAQSGAGKECLSCAAFHGNSSHCEESLASHGFTRGCRSGVALVWSEVWCRAASPKATPVPKEVLAQLDSSTGHPPATPVADAPNAPPPLPPTGGCGGCATPRPETAIWAPMLALGALAVGWSRRRNRR